MLQIHRMLTSEKQIYEIIVGIVSVVIYWNTSFRKHETQHCCKEIAKEQLFCTRYSSDADSIYTMQASRMMFQPHCRTYDLFILNELQDIINLLRACDACQYTNFKLPLMLAEIRS